MEPVFDGSSSESENGAATPPPPPPPRQSVGGKKRRVRDEEPEQEHAKPKNGRTKRPTVAQLKVLESQRDQFFATQPLMDDALAWLQSFYSDTPKLLKMLQKQSDDFGPAVQRLMRAAHEASGRLAEIESKYAAALASHERQMAVMLAKYEAMVQSMAASMGGVDFAFDADPDHGARHGGGAGLGDMTASPPHH